MCARPYAAVDRRSRSRDSSGVRKEAILQKESMLSIKIAIILRLSKLLMCILHDNAHIHISAHCTHIC